MKFLTILASLLLAPLSVAGDAIPEPNSDEVMFDSPLMNWKSPYKRAPLQKRDLEERNSVNLGPYPFVVYMCRDAARTDCDQVWVSASQYCYDNTQWFGWKTSGTPVAVKVVGTTCCAFYADKLCNKPGNYLGWIKKVCEGDTGDAATIPGVMASYMCNVPYGSAGTAMDSSPSDVKAVPSSQSGVEAATMKARSPDASALPKA